MEQGHRHRIDARRAAPGRSSRIEGLELVARRPSSRPPTSRRSARSTSGRAGRPRGRTARAGPGGAISMTSAKPSRRDQRDPGPPSPPAGRWWPPSCRGPAARRTLRRRRRRAAAARPGRDRPAWTAPSRRAPSSPTTSVKVPPRVDAEPHAISVAASVPPSQAPALRDGGKAAAALGRSGQRPRSRRPRRPVRTPPVTASITARFAGSPSFRPFRSVTSKPSTALPSTVRTPPSARRRLRWQTPP